MAISYAELKQIAEEAAAKELETKATIMALRGVDRLEFDIAQSLKSNAATLGRDKFLKHGELRYTVWAEHLYPLASLAEAASRFTDFDVTIVAEMHDGVEFKEAAAIFRSRF